MARIRRCSIVARVSESATTDWLACTGQSGLTSPELSFRRIDEDDADFLQRLYASTRWQELSVTPWSDEEKMQFLKQQFTAQHRHYQTHFPDAALLLIEHNTRPVGRIYIDRDATSICLIDIALLPEHRGMGIGGQLLKELLTEAAMHNKKVVLHVENSNPAHGWYLQHGFKDVENRGVYQYLEWHPD